MHHLSQWQNISLMAARRPITDPLIGMELNNEKISHFECLKNQALTNELKCILIRECLKTPEIV